MENEQEVGEMLLTRLYLGKLPRNPDGTLPRPGDVLEGSNPRDFTWQDVLDRMHAAFVAEPVPGPGLMAVGQPYTPQGVAWQHLFNVVGTFDVFLPFDDLAADMDRAGRAIQQRLSERVPAGTTLTSLNDDGQPVPVSPWNLAIWILLDLPMLVDEFEPVAGEEEIIEWEE